MKGEKISKSLVDPRNAKNKKYKKAMHEIFSEGVCPFCPETFKWHTKPILKRDGDWLITENFSPYKNSEHHLLIIGKAHKETLDKITAKDWKSVSKLIAWASTKFKIDGGGLIIRFGNTLKTGATVKHLHWHLITPKVKNGVALPVYFPIG